MKIYSVYSRLNDDFLILTMANLFHQSKVKETLSNEHAKIRWSYSIVATENKLREKFKKKRKFIENLYKM